MMNIRLSSRMLERPVRQHAIFVFDYRRQRQGQSRAGMHGRQLVERYRGIDFELLSGFAYSDSRIQRFI
jgi:hypothetical protein